MHLELVACPPCFWCFQFWKLAMCPRPWLGESLSKMATGGWGHQSPESGTAVVDVIWQSAEGPWACAVQLGKPPMAPHLKPLGPPHWAWPVSEQKTAKQAPQTAADFVAGASIGTASMRGSFCTNFQPKWTTESKVMTILVSQVPSWPPHLPLLMPL